MCGWVGGCARVRVCTCVYPPITSKRTLFASLSAAGTGVPRAAGSVSALPCGGAQHQRPALRGRLASRGRPAPWPARGQARPARNGRLGREASAGGPVPSCDLDGQAHPAATLLRRWRWISDHRHTTARTPKLAPVPVDLTCSWNTPRTTTAGAARLYVDVTKRPSSWIQCRLT